MRGSPPLRFLAIVLGGWVALRTAVIAPLWLAPPGNAVVAQSLAPPLPHRNRPAGPDQAERSVAGAEAPLPSTIPAAIPAPGRSPPARPLPAMAVRPLAPPAGAQVAFASVAPLLTPSIALPPPPAAASAGRWSLSAWSFVRRGGSAGLATGGLLGGSQAGARLAFRLNRDPARSLALSFRLSTPLRGAAGAEAALGLDWKPTARLPVHLLAERRQALGRDGRSAFGLTAYGGVGDARLGRFRIDAYAQAGIVGARARDPYGDGSIRLSLPLGERVRMGVGAWAAVQPRLSRLDVGPQAAVRLPVAGHALTLAADWRLRAAGNAAPGSGPTLTLGTDF